MRRRKITIMATPMLDMVMLMQVMVTLMVRLNENRVPRRGR
jgi:hypothetical protein